MTHDEIIDYCLSKRGAYLDYPFDPVFSVAKVKAPSDVVVAKLPKYLQRGLREGAYEA